MESGNFMQVVVDDRSSGLLAAEPGLAVWIHWQNRNWLFDTGSGVTLADNLGRLDLDLDDLDGLILSHGHWDHSGGVAWVLGFRPDLPVYGHPGIFQDRWAIHGEETPKSTTIPEADRRALEGRPQELNRWYSTSVELTPGLVLTGEIPRESGPSCVEGHFTDLQGEEQDVIPDDQALVIDSAQGPVVLTGCCHSGVENTLVAARTLAGEKRLMGFVGGLHLKRTPVEEVRRLAGVLNDHVSGFVAPCHCTGDQAIGILSRELPHSFRNLRAGDVISLN